MHLSFGRIWICHVEAVESHHLGSLRYPSEASIERVSIEIALMHEQLERIETIKIYGITWDAQGRIGL